MKTELLNEIDRETVKIRRDDFEKALENAVRSEFAEEISEYDERVDYVDVYDEENKFTGVEEQMVRCCYGYRYEHITVDLDGKTWEFDYCKMFSYDEGKEDEKEHYEDENNGRIQNENNIEIIIVDYDGDEISSKNDHGDFTDMAIKILGEVR